MPTGAGLESWCGKSKRVKGTRHFEISMENVLEASPWKPLQKKKGKRKRKKIATKFS